ncbi:DNA-binding SARP family transcriptional activator [Kribbella aluminosa]|uniref:DNA-binding SARP family transcriptional activator n=1 Tax=Kribbella aluminosa TaxID=416017 RepID=A0ABS4UCM3_9ACTN|nr:BTAD domain-containing putative transcriptional regulator [Kribbella aluminosa]MBP2349393.1 DNA-binding SARP family transcriptional activator [Kribbella aluminosa]
MDERYRGRVEFGVLGPVMAWDRQQVDLKGPRHRAVLARLIVARGRVVPASVLVDDLWADPPEGALSALRTFVAALRRAIEPDRAPRAPARLLVTDGPGYALRTENVDATRFEASVNASVRPERLLPELVAGLELWRGPAYAEFADEPWALAERSRLTELRLRAAERVGATRLDLGLAAEAVPDLDAHVTQHPWREDAWRLLALALYRSDRQGDALAVLRRARETLVGQLGVDPGPALARLERDILNQATHLAPAGNVWAETAAAYDRAVGGTRARIESTVGLLRNLAVTGGGGLEAARRHRLAAVAAAEELGDPDVTARIIGAYDVPAIWTRSDDEAQAAAIVAAAERVLPTQDHPSIRARLLATIALESRGSRETRPREAALEAEQLARGLDDPALLAFTLNGVFMQTCYRTGLAPARDAIGAELVTLSQRHNLFTYEVLGQLIRLQSACARADYTAADEHAAAADAMAARHELPLVAVFTRWYAALREDTPESYRAAAALLADAGMPGLTDGLLPLALATHAVRHDDPIPAADYGPSYTPWVHDAVGSRTPGADTPGAYGEDARRARGVLEPPAGLLLEVHWALIAHAARRSDDAELLATAQEALAPAGEEHAAGSGMITMGPISDYLA